MSYYMTSSNAIINRRVDFSTISLSNNGYDYANESGENITYNGKTVYCHTISGNMRSTADFGVVDMHPFSAWEKSNQDTQNSSTFSPQYRFASNLNTYLCCIFGMDRGSYYWGYILTNNKKTPFGVAIYDINKILYNTSSESSIESTDLFGFCFFEHKGYTYFVSAKQKYYTSGYYYLSFSGYRIDDIQKFGNLDIKEKSDEYGNYSEQGGYSGGGFDDSSDTISIPNKPSLSVSSMGFVNVYKPSVGSLSSMVDELFPQVDVPNIPTGDTLADVVNSLNGLIDTVANGIVQFGNKNLLDYVLDAHIIPVTPTTSASNNIKVGYKTLSISAPKVSDDYVDFDCGTLSIKEYYSNYIDYTACNISLYLPFVGFVPILPEYVFNGKLRVVYRFNILDGSFCAWVLSTSSKSNLSDSVIGSFSGNCCVHIPISATNYSNVISGLVGGVSSMLNALPSKGNVSVEGAVDSASSIVQSLKPEVALSNGYNATSSYSGIRFPYLIIRRQVASFSQNYPKENGLPLNVTDELSKFKGLTIASEIILDGINATDTEKQMIKNRFKEGVIL